MAQFTALVAFVDLWLTRILDAVVIGLSGLLFCLLNYAVFTRFILNDSVSWSEELPAHILAALTFIGAAYLTRTSEHLGFDAVVRILSPGVKRAVMAGNLILMAFFGALLAYYGGNRRAELRAAACSSSVDLPMALFRYAMPVGGALIRAHQPHPPRRSADRTGAPRRPSARKRRVMFLDPGWIS